MALTSGLIGICRLVRRRGGFWGYLRARAVCRSALDLEREHNRATLAALRLLPDGCELLEYERDGRLRVIRKGAGIEGRRNAGSLGTDLGGETGR